MPLLSPETLAGDWGQYFVDYEILIEEKTELQHLILIETKTFGKVLILDNVVQVTEKDNFIYHEALTHIPIMSHGDCQKVLIIGGGDGGMAKEVLKYPGIEVTQVEIDKSVVDFSKKFLTHICEDAYENPRLNLIIDDGFKYVGETEEKYDVIIVDSTDPKGPGEILFSKEFYTACEGCLNEKGILVTQNGLPFTHPEQLQDSIEHFKSLFKVGTCYTATIPTYLGGPMAFGFATNNAESIDVSTKTLEDRLGKQKIHTKYYSPAVHKAAFVLPEYINKLQQTS